MATAGNINVKLTAEQAEFSANIRKASESINGFAQRLDSSHDSLSKFAEKLTESRAGIQTIAGVAGVAAGPLQHLVHAFELAPGPIGAVVAAMLILRETFAQAAEEEKKLMDVHNQYLKSLKEAHPRPDDANHLEKLAELEKQLNEQLLEHQKSWGRTLQVLSETAKNPLFALMGGGVGDPAGDKIKEQLRNIGLERKRLQEEMKVNLKEDVSKYTEPRKEKPQRAQNPAREPMARIEPLHESTTKHILQAVGLGQLGVLKLQHESNPELEVLKEMNRTLKAMQRGAHGVGMAGL